MRQRQGACGRTQGKEWHREDSLRDLSGPRTKELVRGVTEMYIKLPERTKFAALQMSLLWKQRPEQRAAAAELSTFSIRLLGLGWPQRGQHKQQEICFP